MRPKLRCNEYLRLALVEHLFTSKAKLNLKNWPSHQLSNFLFVIKTKKILLCSFIFKKQLHCEP